MTIFDDISWTCYYVHVIIFIRDRRRRLYTIIIITQGMHRILIWCINSGSKTLQTD